MSGKSRSQPEIYRFGIDEIPAELEQSILEDLTYATAIDGNVEALEQVRADVSHFVNVDGLIGKIKEKGLDQGLRIKEADEQIEALPSDRKYAIQLPPVFGLKTSSEGIITRATLTMTDGSTREVEIFKTEPGRIVILTTKEPFELNRIPLSTIQAIS